MDFQMEKDRIYLLNMEGKLVAEITFPEAEKGVAVISHTFVDESLRGQGVAGKLVKAAAEQIRASGKKARAACSYAAAWFEKHPEEGDILLP